MYDDTYKNIFVRTTEKYTLEDDLAAAGTNEQNIKDYFETDEFAAEFLKDSKADNMRRLCEAISENEIVIEMPKHIGEIIECVKDY